MECTKSFKLLTFKEICVGSRGTLLNNKIVILPKFLLLVLNYVYNMLSNRDATELRLRLRKVGTSD